MGEKTDDPWEPGVRGTAITGGPMILSLGLCGGGYPQSSRSGKCDRWPTRQRRNGSAGNRIASVHGNQHSGDEARFRRAEKTDHVTQFLRLSPAAHRSSCRDRVRHRSEEHTSELQSLMRTSYAVLCLKKKKTTNTCNQVQKTSRTH